MVLGKINREENFFSHSTSAKLKKIGKIGQEGRIFSLNSFNLDEKRDIEILNFEF